MSALDLQDVAIIADNDHGYRFGVGRCGDRWIGFACGSESAARARAAFRGEGLDVDPDCLFVFPEVSDNCNLGILDRTRAILLVGAVAQDPESAYGGVDHWRVPEELRGRPDDYRCKRCDAVGCQGDCGEDS